MMQNDFDWTDEERDGLRSYGASVTPSETLRQRTMNALREQKLLGARRRREPVVRPFVGVAAAIAILAAAANYLSDRSHDNENVVAGTVVDRSATTTKIERHVIWF
jgi:hypothetical protein